MTEREILGKIEKPAAGLYTGKRKLYFVRNVYLIDDIPADYRELFDRYWDDVSEQTGKLEVAGRIVKIFCESIYLPDKEGIEALTTINRRVAEIVRKKIEEGAVLVPLEEKAVFGPLVDWGNCLGVVRTDEVFSKILVFYRELMKRRFSHIISVIEENLKEGEAGLLIMRDEDRNKITFPPDIEVFLVTPPSYDDIMKWFRETVEGGKGEKDPERS